MIDPTPTNAADENSAGEPPIENLGHPRGTLAIVVLYGILFALGWIGLYFLEFAPRGLPQ